jgi:kynurenine formamidase
MTTSNESVSLEVVEALADCYRNWGRWGESDEIGTLNYVTDQHVLEASRCVRKGKVFSLGIPMDEHGPLIGRWPRFNPSHVMFRDGGDVTAALSRGEHGYISTDDAVFMPLQCATQWDALSHPFYNGRMYNGAGPEHVTSYGATRNSITAAKDRMVGRGVLLDMPRLSGRDWLDRGEAIEAADLAECCERQDVEVGEGDFVLVRTGRLAEVRATGEWDGYVGSAAPGLGVSAAEFFCPRNVAAVATDCFTVEVVPSQTSAVGLRCPIHVIMTVSAGIHVGEEWDLEALADDCAEDGHYEFFLTAAPLTITGSVGSPINPQAIK